MKIIRVDHISFIEGYSEDEKLHNYVKGISCKWSEKGLKNIDSKKRYFISNHDSHDLVFFEGYDLPIEQIKYYPDEYYYSIDGIKICSDVHVKNGKIYASYNAAEPVKELINILGGNVELIDNEKLIVHLKGIFDKKATDIILEKKDQMFRNYLDAPGFGCLTLSVMSLEKIEKFRAIPKCEITYPESLVVNGNELEISFVSLPNINFIFELITPKRG